MSVLFGALLYHSLCVPCGLLVEFGNLNAYFLEEIVLPEKDKLTVSSKLVLFPLLQRIDDTDYRHVLVSFL